MILFLEEAASSGGMGYSSIIMIVAMFAIFYFLIIRPENKKKKITFAPDYKTTLLSNNSECKIKVTISKSKISKIYFLIKS